MKFKKAGVHFGVPSELYLPAYIAKEFSVSGRNLWIIRVCLYSFEPRTLQSRNHKLLLVSAIISMSDLGIRKDLLLCNSTSYPGPWKHWLNWDLLIWHTLPQLLPILDYWLEMSKELCFLNIQLPIQEVLDWVSKPSTCEALMEK